MIKISKSEREALESVGLLRPKKVGYNACDANFTVVNREHLSRSKKTYVTEEPEIMLFLGRYQGLNLQRITYKQFKQLLSKKLISRDRLQNWGTYVPNAQAFEGPDGMWRVKKTPKVMIELGFWSENKRPRYVNQGNKDFGEIFGANADSAEGVNNIAENSENTETENMTV